MKTSFHRFARNIKLLFSLDVHRLLWRLVAIEKSIRGLTEMSLLAHPLYRQDVHHVEGKSEINKHEFRLYSQNGEDGIVLWLFSRIGTTTKRFVEFGMGTGRECISSNLVLNMGWKGYFMDGSAENVADAKLFFKLMMPWEEFSQLQIEKQFVTKENINSLLATRKHKEEIDLLCIDIDGNDYWVWKEISVVKPRVVVLEYNATLGPTKSITIPYDQSFYAYSKHPLGIYHGTSLGAAVKLGKEKGYVFVGCDTRGANAFFVLKGLADDLETTPENAYYDNQHHTKRGTREERWEMIKDYNYTTI